MTSATQEQTQRRYEVNRARAWEAFQKDTAEHVVTQVVESGDFRLVRVQKPGSPFYAYSLTTWPGYLAVTGDMGAWVFSRVPDMFAFFRGPVGTIKPGYWSEKLVAADTTSKVEHFDIETLREHLHDCFADEPDRLSAYLDALDDVHPDDEAAALQALEDAGLQDSWDTSRHQYSHHFLWILHAIVHGIAKYDDLKRAEVAA